jgi:hypothetical protein
MLFGQYQCQCTDASSCTIGLTGAIELSLFDLHVHFQMHRRFWFFMLSVEPVSLFMLHLVQCTDHASTHHGIIVSV